MKKVSIIIPVYNAERYLEQTLISILNQDYACFELILVNDGSTDKTQTIIEKYAKHDNRIIKLEQENKGAPYARNQGIKIANGNYIYFFDADDMMLKTGLRHMIDAIESNDVDLIIGSFEMEIPNGNQVFSFENEVVFVRNNFEVAMEKLTTIGAMPGNKLFLNSIVKQYQIFFDSVGIGQDCNFFYKYLCHINKFMFIHHPTYLYKNVRGSITNSYTLKILDIEKSLAGIQRHYETEGINISNQVWFQKLCLAHYNNQYSKIIYLRTYLQRKKALRFFKLRIEDLKKNMPRQFYQLYAINYEKTKYRDKVLVLPLISSLFHILRTTKHHLKKNKGVKI